MPDQPATHLPPAPSEGAPRWPWLLLGFALTAGAILWGVQRGPLALRAKDAPTATPAPAPAATAAEATALATLGDGFVVWESRRSGAWRIWRRDFAGARGSAAARLSPDEPGRNHCCAQISPDGSRVAYLSLPADMPYGEAIESGTLRVMAGDGAASRALVETARTYGSGHRAVVWHDDQRLAYIGAGGESLLLDLASGAITALAPAADPARGGWLINATRTHATSGTPTFSPYDAKGRSVAPQTALGGCEPVFSHDGRFGVWVAGAGGPLYRMDLANRSSASILEKNDPRLGGSATGGAGYVYFPMLARSGDALVFGASSNEHDHERGNYDVYVAEVHPETLEILGSPWRATDDPGSDRYPDIHVAPLALGRRHGEAPFTVTFAEAPGASPAKWTFGDGASGSAATHTYTAPGTYSVEARAGGEVRRGRVTVAAARPPTPEAVRVRGARELLVVFDEPVAAAGAAASLGSGRALAPATATGADDARTLRFALAAGEPELDAGDTLTLTGVADRAQRPNVLAPTVLQVPAPVWPSDRRGLAFLWAAADQPNLVRVGSAERAWALAPSGRARLEHGHGMALDGGGAFVAEAAAGEWLATAAKASNTIGLELVLAAARREQAGTIVSFGRPQGEPNLVLAQRGSALVLRLLTARAAAPEIEIARLPDALPHHLAFTYAPGDLRAWLDGVETLRSTALQRDFFRWRPAPLRFGSDPRAAAGWAGTLRSIAIYERRLDGDEVAENHRRWVREAGRRAAVPRVEVLARRIATSQAPTLAEVAPYRQALVAHAYAIEKTLLGEPPGPRIAVAHWALLDGEPQPAAHAPRDEQVRLVLEPYASNPQIQSDVLKNTLPGDLRTLPMFLDIGLE